jgi:hypothetical protein
MTTTLVFTTPQRGSDWWKTVIIITISIVCPGLYKQPRKITAVDGVESVYRSFTALGMILIVSGFVLVSLPFIVRHLPTLDRLPWILVWVYRRDGFYFATSPLLILISLISLLLNLINRVH